MSDNLLINPQPVEVADLLNLRAQLEAGQLPPFAVYAYMAERGYLYGYLAGGVAADNLVSGDFALSFLTTTAEQQSSPVSAVQLERIKVALAKAYLDTLHRYAVDSGTSAVTQEISARDAWVIHNQVFRAENLPDDAWTLNTVFGFFTEDSSRELFWQKGLVQASLFATDPGSSLLGELTYTKDLAGLLLEQLVGGTPEAQKAALNWINRVTDIRGLGDANIVHVISELAPFVGSIVLAVLKNGGAAALQGVSDSLAGWVRAARGAGYGWLGDVLAGAAGVVAPASFDPLTVDLSQDGLLTAPRAQGAYFDMQGEGFAESTGWVQAGDALVVRDLDGNGTIDTGAELFGDQTVLLSGLKAANGYAALAALDSNSDGQFDAADAAWAEVRLWKDNGDGRTQAGELLSFEAAGVQALKLNYATVNTPDSAGNVLAQSNATGAVLADGSTVTTGSFLLTSDSMDSLPTEYLSVTANVLALPELIGSGKTYDLSQAMARDAALESLVTTVAQSSDYFSLPSQFEQVLLRWTGADQVSTTSRGSFINAQHLAAVEAFYGQRFFSSTGSYLENHENPNQTAAAILESAYQTLKDQLCAQFVSQAQLKTHWDSVTVTWDEQSQSAVADYSGLLASLAELPTMDARIKDMWLIGRTAKALGFDTSAAFQAFASGLSNEGGGYAAVLQSGFENRALQFGTEGADTVALAGSAIHYYGGAGDDQISGNGTNVRLFGGDGNDTLTSGGSTDVLVGGAGNDVLLSGAGADLLMGEAGDDVLGGTDANELNGYTTGILFTGNTYIGGQGNDTLRGTNGADTYVFGLGDGQDTIVEPTGAYSGGFYWDLGADVLKFDSPISPADIRVSRTGNDLVFAHVNGVDKVTVQGWYAYIGSDLRKLATVTFADGTIWTQAQLTAEGLHLQGSAGNDSLEGQLYWNNVLEGNDGDDILTGGRMGDTLNGGAGNDTLDGGLGSDVLKGGAGDDVLGGSATSADSGAGRNNPNEYDSSANASFVGNDYEGGTGSDTLRGTFGADVYRFNLGDGSDTLIESGIQTGYYGYVPHDWGNDTLIFGAGIGAADIGVSRAGNDLLLQHVNGTDQVRVKDWYVAEDTGRQLTTVQFADGTTWSNAQLSAWGASQQGTEAGDTMTGITLYANMLDGRAGNDVLKGGWKADTLSGGDGSDTLDGDRGADTLDGGAGDDILGGGAGTWDTGYYDGAGFRGPGAGNLYIGGTGNDLLRGTTYSDQYVFNLGDDQDTLVEAEVYGQPAGQQDVLQFGAGVEETRMRLVRSGADLLVQVEGSADQVTVKNWYAATPTRLERVDFANGRVWDAAAINAHIRTVIQVSPGSYADYWNYANTAILELTGTSGGDSIGGSQGIDVIYGNEGDDYLGGNAGDDWLYGGSGANTLIGGEGTDTYAFLPVGGTDTVFDWQNPDAPSVSHIWAGPGITAASLSVELGIQAGDLTLVHQESNSRMTIVGGALRSTSNIADVTFSDGTRLTLADLQSRLAVSSDYQGTAAADSAFILNTLAGPLDMGAGDDTVVGQASGTVQLGDGSDLLYSDGPGAVTAFGGAGADNLVQLNLEAVSTILLGDEGDDWLNSQSPRSLSLGGTGNDFIFAQGGVAAGGAGNDTIGGDARVVLFNKQDGMDSVWSFAGGGVYSIGQTPLEELNVHLGAYGEAIIQAGAADSLTVQGGPGAAAGLLQLITTSAEGAPQIRLFDFGAVSDYLMTQADWSLENPMEHATISGLGLTPFELALEAGTAYGGDLAVQYAQTGSLEGLAQTRAADVHQLLRSMDSSGLQLLGGLNQSPA